MKYHCLTAGILLYLAASTTWAGPENVIWPGDYKQAFTHYFSGDRTADDKQIIRIYANDTAVKGIRDKGKLPYGSVLVGELYTVKLDENDQPVISSLGRKIVNDLAAIVIMQRGEGFDAGYPDHLTTGDWEFAVFNAAGKKLDKDISGCRGCHHPLIDREFVFSYEHLR